MVAYLLCIPYCSDTGTIKNRSPFIITRIPEPCQAKPSRYYCYAVSVMASVKGAIYNR